MNGTEYYKMRKAEQENSSLYKLQMKTKQEFYQDKPQLLKLHFKKVDRVVQKGEKAILERLEEDFKANPKYAAEFLQKMKERTEVFDPYTKKTRLEFIWEGCYTPENIKFYANMERLAIKYSK